EEHPGQGHYGIIGMRERALQIHGRLDIRSGPTEGTTVQIDLPIPNGTSVIVSPESEQLA
ncbi:MAG TPA: hypothetical protein VNQ76_04320, partial [Planctomicrobium sp.]|nr:hypothetical protein [Planctomicrobium sp.]